jgi:hypothetical protein
MILGAKILRDRLEISGESPDAESVQTITGHALPLYAWTGTTPDSELAEEET